VNGEAKVGNSGVACSTSTQGALRYNIATSAMEFCNGTSWTLLQVSACSGTTPSTFTFSNQSNLTTSTLVQSDIVALSNFNCMIPVTISGLGSPSYRICSDSACNTVVQDWTTTSHSISSGQYLQLQQTTPAAGGATYRAVVIAGNTASVWSATTTGGDCTGSPAIGTICADGSVYAGLSPDGNVPMYTQRCDLGQSWDNVAGCIGTAWLVRWNNGTQNWVSTNYMNELTGQSNTAGLVALADVGAPYEAATDCDALNEDGHTDWYLPAKNELNTLAVNKVAIGGFDVSGTPYWTSTESDGAGSLFVRFSDGIYSAALKDAPLRVRCVRR
jgi:hypothetical protein